MNVEADELDPDAPIPYTLTSLGKAECILGRLRSRAHDEYSMNKLWFFRQTCIETFRPDEVEALFG